MYIKRSILKKYQILLNVSLTGVVVPPTIIEYISQFTIAIVYFTDFLENLTTLHFDYFLSIQFYKALLFLQAVLSRPYNIFVY